MMSKNFVYIFEKYAFNKGSQIVMVSQNYDKVKSCFNKFLNYPEEGYGYFIAKYECGKEYDAIDSEKIMDWIEINYDGKIMQQNYKQVFEKQILQENTYVGGANTQNIDHELENLSKEYCIRKIYKLREYLKKDERLINYIHSITPIIKKYFPNHKKYLTYYIDPEFEELNSAKICVIGNDSLFEKEHALMNRLNEELLYSTDYPVEVKSLISVRMWWL